MECKNKCSFKVSLASTVLLVTSPAISDDLTIPNTFQPNTPARAADVNANFSAVEASVDDNAADIAANTSSIASNAQNVGTNVSNISANSTAIAVNTANISSNLTAIENNAASIAALSAIGGISVYSQGQPIGRLLSFSPTWFLLSDQSFVFSPSSPQYGGARNIYFAELNCAGQAFVENRNIGPWTAEILSMGMVFSALDAAAAPAPVYYSSRGSQPSVRAYASVVDNNICNNLQGSLSFYEVFPNDEQVTGVPNIPPSGPLLLGAP